MIILVLTNFVKQSETTQNRISEKEKLLEKGLYTDAFFLHSFLDENIGSEIGNDFVKTINEFSTYSPEPYASIFKYASETYLSLVPK